MDTTDAPPRPFQFSLRELMALTALVAVAILCCDLGSITAWIGHFPLEVHLASPADRAIVAVSAATAPKVSDAAELRIDPRRLDLDLQDVGWVAGQPFTLRVACFGKTSYFDRELSYYEDRLLVLCVEYDDGPVEYLPAPIPPGRGSRKVLVGAVSRRR